MTITIHSEGIKQARHLWRTTVEFVNTRPDAYLYQEMCTQLNAMRLMLIALGIDEQIIV